MAPQISRHSGTIVATATSIGTSTTKTQLNGGSDLRLPGQVKCILSVTPYLVIYTPTATENCMASLTLESDDFQINPYVVMANPIGSHLGASGHSGFIGALPKFPVNCPVSGGSNLRVYGTALTANTVAPYMGCEIEIADYIATPQYHAKLGTGTSTGTSAAEVTGSGIKFSGGRRLKMAYGVVAGTTLAASKPFLGYFRFSSSEFTPSWDLRVPVQPIGGQLGTLGHEFISGIHRADQDIDLTDNGQTQEVQIQDYFNLEVAVTTAGKFMAGVMWI